MKKICFAGDLSFVEKSVGVMMKDKLTELLDESPKEEYAFLFFKCCKLISKQGLQIIQDLKGAYPKRKLTTGVDHEKRCNDFDRSRSDRYGHRPPYRIW